MIHSFDQDPRTDHQRCADLDNPSVTVSMYAVDDHGGERKGGSVFLAGPGDWDSVEGTYRQFKADTGFSGNQVQPYGDAGDIWLVADDHAPGLGVVRVAGAAEVRRTPEGGQLWWIWVHPLRRGSTGRGSIRGLTGLLAGRLREEYGAVFASREPVTPAGRRFLDRYFGARRGGPEASGAAEQGRAGSRLRDPEQLAEELGRDGEGRLHIVPFTIRTAVKRGQVKAIRGSRGKVLFDDIAVEALLEFLRESAHEVELESEPDPYLELEGNPFNFATKAGQGRGRRRRATSGLGDGGG